MEVPVWLRETISSHWVHFLLSARDREGEGGGQEKFGCFEKGEREPEHCTITALLMALHDALICFSLPTRSHTGSLHSLCLCKGISAMHMEIQAQTREYIC